MKYKRNNKSLSDKIADALTVKPRADIEDDHIFGTKPNTVSRDEFNSSGSEDEALISEFRKRNVNLLSDISKKYEGKVVSRKKITQISDEESAGDKTDDSESDENENDLIIQSNSKHITDDQYDKERKNSSIAIIQKQLNSDQSDDESDEDGVESDDYSITNIRKQIHSDSSENESGQDDNENNEEYNLDEKNYDISEMDTPMKEDFQHVKKQNISEEAKKGICVRNQLLLWEGLLEMRIHLQKCLNSANKMPLPELCKELKQSKDFVNENNLVAKNVSSVLEKLLSLQGMLLKKFPETKTISTTQENESAEKKPKEDSDEEIPSDTDNEEIPSDTENEEVDDNNIKTQIANGKLKTSINTKRRKLTDYENDIASCHKKFKSFRDSTIQKWNEKTRIATAANSKNTPTNTILQQITYILSDRHKLVRRTQLKRSDYDIVGYKKESINNTEEETGISNPIIRDRRDDDEYIAEIFDDSDFYHQLLRELIECKSADISDPIQLSRQWISLQQMRSKMKRKVDTKATKGRKIKYVVHNKLLNLMGPEPLTKWNAESVNELYSSLFGKMFEQNNVGLNVNLENISLSK